MIKTSRVYDMWFRGIVLLILTLACLPTQGQNIVVSEEILLKNDLAYEVIGKLDKNWITAQAGGSRP